MSVLYRKPSRPTIRTKNKIVALKGGAFWVNLMYMKKVIFCLLLAVFSAHVIFAKETKPLVALVLSGGAANGIAEIPLLEALEEEGIQVDMVLGVSMGAIIGSFYASGYTPKEIRELFTSLDIPAFLNQKATTAKIMAPIALKPYNSNYFSVDFSKDGIGSQTGVLGDQKITNIIASCIAKTSYIDDFDKLPKKFRAVSTDVFTGQKIISADDSLVMAVRDSMSIPIVFPPFPTSDGSLAYDGGLADNLPIQLAKDLGADIIIAMDVLSNIGVSQEKFSSINSSVMQSINLLISTKVVTQYKDADILLQPDLSAVNALEFGNPQKIMEIGEKEVEKHRAELHALALELEKAGLELKKLDPDRKSYYDSLPAPVVQSVRVRDISSEQNRSLPKPEELRYFVGKALTDEELVKLSARLEQLRYEYNLSTLTFQLRELPGSSDSNSFELEILANYHVERHNQFFVGGRPALQSTFGTGQKAAFRVFPFFTAGAKLEGSLPVNITLSSDEYFSGSLAFCPMLYKNENIKLRSLFAVGGKYGILHPEEVLTYSTLFADDDFGFDFNSGLNLQIKDTMSLNSGFLYDFTYLHDTKTAFNNICMYWDFAWDTLRNDITSLNGIRLDSQVLFGYDFSQALVYSAKMICRRNFELKHNTNSIGFEFNAFANGFSEELLKGYFDAGTFDGMCGYGYGSFLRSGAFAGLSYRHILFSIADMPFVAIAQAKFGFLNFETFDVGPGLYLAMTTPIGTILFGGSFAAVSNKWCMELSFR